MINTLTHSLATTASTCHQSSAKPSTEYESKMKAAVAMTTTTTENYNSCFKGNNKICVCNNTKFLCISLAIFLCHICCNMQFCKVAHCNSNMLTLVSLLHLHAEQTLHFVMAMDAPFFLHLVGHEPFYQFQVHLVDSSLDLSLVIIWAVVLSVLLLMIHCPCYISHLLSLTDLSLSEHSQV